MSIEALKIIKVGTISIEPFEDLSYSSIALKRLCGIGGGSTVTYIKSDISILVDTGFDYENDFTKRNLKWNHENLKFALKSHNISPDDIDLVFITHWHRDHFGNIGLFNNSEFVTLKEIDINTDLKINAVKDGEKLADGVSVLHTPGHTKSHASIVVELPDMRYESRFLVGGHFLKIPASRIVIAGDAIVSSSYYYGKKIWKNNSDFYSETKSFESINKITKIADFVIPGHGSMFKILNEGF